MLFGEGRAGYADDTFHRRGKQIDFDKRTGDNVAFVVELESDRYVITAFARSFAVRQQTAAQLFQCIYLIIIGRAEVGRGYGRQCVVVFLGNIGTEEEATVLRDADQRLTYGDVIALLHQQALDVTADGRNNCLSLRGMVAGYGFVADAGILVCLFGLGKFLFGNNLAGYQRLHAFVFFLADFVGDAGFLYGVTFGHVLR